MHARDTPAIVTIVVALALGILLGLRLQGFVASIYEERVALDFRLAATQRAAIVREALIRPVEGLEVLRRFFEGGDHVDEGEFDAFIAPWLHESPDTVYSAYRVEGERLVATHGTLNGEAAMRARELSARLADDGKPAALILGDEDSAGSALLMATVAHTQPGDRIVVFALMDLSECVESAIGSTEFWGLPLSVLDRSVPPRLLHFHYPRLDAALGSPLMHPEANPRYSLGEFLVIAGTTLDIRVDASPKYREQRRRYLYLFISPTVALIAFFFALGLNAIRKRAVLAEAGRSIAATELECFFSVDLDLLCIFNTEGFILRLNPAWESVLGYPLDELVGRNLGELLHEEDLPAALASLNALLTGAPPCAFVDRLRTKTGDYKRIEWRAAAVDGLVYAAARDVTDRVLNEARLTRALHEKETLLREVHHRVKNNLQIIASVLNLHGEEAGDPNLSAIIERAQNRIRSMALVHEALYRSEDFSGVDFRDYARSLIADYEVGSGGKPVQIFLETDPIMLDLDLAVHCGLLLNELATNAAKHALPSSVDPALTIMFHETDGELFLAVEDNGPGLPADFDIVRNAHLGLKIAGTLAAQLAGSVDALKALPGRYLTGARFELTFRPAPGSFKRRGTDAAPRDL